MHQIRAQLEREATYLALHRQRDDMPRAVDVDHRLDVALHRSDLDSHRPHHRHQQRCQGAEAQP
jgi:hypothetical protein